MGTDPFSPIAPARVRVLVLPFGKITNRRFKVFARRLEQVSTVRLGDLTPDPRPGRGKLYHNNGLNMDSPGKLITP